MTAVVVFFGGGERAQRRCMTCDVAGDGDGPLAGFWGRWGDSTDLYRLLVLAQLEGLFGLFFPVQNL